MFLNIHIGIKYLIFRAEKLASLTTWLKEQPGAKAEKQVCGAEILEEEVVDAIEKAVDRFVKTNDRCKTVTMQVKPHLLYQVNINYYVNCSKLLKN